jgi:nucleotide-binding universal stress UspA family protein
MKLILVPVADRPECVFALDTAFHLAGKLDASVVGCHLRPHRPEVATADGFRLKLSIVAAGLDEIAEDVVSLNSDNARRLFSAVAEKNEVKLSRKLRPSKKPLAHWMEMVGTPDRIMGIVGPLADLVIVSRPKKKATGPARAFMLAALINSGGPVLVLPQKKTKPGDRICIAWNGSSEAAKAVKAAMPLLQLADSVHIVSCGKSDHPGPSVSQLGNYLALWGVKSSSELTRGRNPEKELLEQYHKHRSDLLVMGAYSRSHLLERVLGGVTHAMLNEADVNLFALHS